MVLCLQLRHWVDSLTILPQSDLVKLVVNFKEKGFAHILLFLLLLAGIGIGVYLVQIKTNLFSKAPIISGNTSGNVQAAISSFLGAKLEGPSTLKTGEKGKFKATLSGDAKSGQIWITKGDGKSEFPCPSGDNGKPYKASTGFYWCRVDVWNGASIEGEYVTSVVGEYTAVVNAYANSDMIYTRDPATECTGTPASLGFDASKWSDCGSSSRLTVKVGVLPEKFFPDELSGWDYSPSYMVDSERERVWWCGSSLIGEPGDVIRYRERPLGGQWSPVTQVLKPTFSREGQCTCDPTVIKGNFTLEWQPYQYAMYYTASPNCANNNAVWVAFSNDGFNWIKNGQPVIMSQSTNANTEYAAGQPVAFNRNGKITVMYTDTGDLGVAGTLSKTRQFSRDSMDGINFGPAKMVTVNGLGLGTSGGFASAAWGYRQGYLYTVTLTPNIQVWETHLSIYSIPESQLFGGYWKKIADIPQAKPYPWDQFEPGFRVDPTGYLLHPIEVVFAGGRILPWMAGQDPTAPESWELYHWTWR